MKLYLFVDLKNVDLLYEVINNPLQDFNKILIYTEKSYESQIMVSFDYDTYIMLLDQNKIEIV